ncbi:hypothetical protein [Halalkalicoccus tibetensis]|uniref:Uncharacterized protein n=1 Tax=Halalkalicoccus tibetensis TaxID=175632 RepID=A0ABD5VD88_9EURY
MSNKRRLFSSVAIAGVTTGLVNRYETEIRSIVAKLRSNTESYQQHPVDDLPGDIVVDWNERLINALREDEADVETVVRTGAILNLAIYDAVNGINTARATTASADHYYVDPATADPPTKASRLAAASAVAHRSLSELFDHTTNSIDTSVAKDLAKSEDDGSVKAGIEWGCSVADDYLELHTSGTDHFKYDYEPSNGPGKFDTEWGSPELAFIDPWSLKRRQQFRPSGPPALESPRYAESWYEIYKLGEKADDQPQACLDIAEFWRGSAKTARPPGRWNMIAQRVARDQELSLSENTRLFALLSLALADSAIATWEAKLHYDMWRPYSAINNANTEDNADTFANEDWKPNAKGGSPEYPSGLAAMGAAGKTILEAFFGDDQSFELEVRSGLDADKLEDQERSFESFEEALQESITG